LSIVIGSERMRRPVVWNTALAMAAETPKSADLQRVIASLQLLPEAGAQRTL
jgi:hypothetical protein